MVALTMDPSSRVEFILGEDIRVNFNKMTTGEWLEILKHAVKIAKPYLKYMSDFKPLSELMQISPKEPLHAIIEESVMMQHPESPNLSLRSLMLCTVRKICSEEMFEITYPGASSLSEPLHISIERILFSNKGELILWSANYRAEEEKYGFGIGTIYYRATEAWFKVIDERSVVTYLCNADKMKRFTFKMCDNVRAEILRINERKKGLEGFEKELNGIMNRIEWPC